MLNNGIKKSVKISLARVYNNVFGSKLKRDLFNMADAYEAASIEAGSAVVSTVNGKALIGIDKEGKNLYIYVESGSGYRFGLDLLRSFGDFTKGFNKYKKSAIEKAIVDVRLKNSCYKTKDINGEVNNWIKSVF